MFRIIFMLRISTEHTNQNIIIETTKIRIQVRIIHKNQFNTSILPEFQTTRERLGKTRAEM